MLCLWVVYSWECGTNSEFDSKLHFTSPRGRQLLERGDTLEPIRISVFYTEFDLGSSEQNTIFKEEVMPAALGLYERTLNVYPLTEPVIVFQDECGDVQIPSEHQTEGVVTDLITYIISESKEAENYVAAAGACYLEFEGRNNVLAGRVIVNSPIFVTLSFEQQITTMAHELAHILGFTSDLFEYFHKDDNTVYSLSELYLVTIVRGIEKRLLRTPTVLEKAREAFDCNTLEGVELESDGGILSSH